MSTVIVLNHLNSNIDQTEVLQWCKDQFEDGWGTMACMSDTSFLYFKDEQCATLFLMRWGGTTHDHYDDDSKFIEALAEINRLSDKILNMTDEELLAETEPPIKKRKSTKARKK